MKVGNERSIIVMGVSGSGKSTIARALATRLEVPFVDGDSLHSPYNVVKMSNGQALSDADRTPWLHLIGQRFKDEASASNRCVVACSALKRKYRDVLREYLPDAFFVMLNGSFETVKFRIEARHHEFMLASLLASQFDDLEPLQSDERGMSVDITLTPKNIVGQIEVELRQRTKND
jgi:carbohydrate kinase (thermoresistant glucokinase family)